MVGSGGLEVSLITAYIFFTYSSRSRITVPHPLSGLNITTAETVHNLSSNILTTDQLEVLKYGLKHPISPLQINKTDVITTFDLIHHARTNDIKDKKYSGELKTKMSHLANSYVNAYKPTKTSSKKHKILKRLRESKDIGIL